MNVFAAFDGHSGGQIALKVIGLKPTKYYASEVDKYAMQGTMAVFPKTIQMGDITKWREWSIDWSTIDLFIGGSPCQGFSMAGKMAGTTAILNGEKIVVDSREKYLELKLAGAEFLSQSYLFWEYILLLDHIKLVNPNIRFFLENVKMKKQFLDLITGAIGVEPIFINSSLVSAQNRQRYYWCNWFTFQPKDKGIVLKDILESEVESSFFHTDSAINYMQQGNEKWQQAGARRADRYTQSEDKEKSFCLTANMHKGVPYNYLEVKGIERVATASDIKGHDYNKRIYSPNGKAPTLAAATGGNLEPKVSIQDSTEECLKNIHYRKLTPRECGRLQTIPEDILDTLLGAGTSRTYEQNFKESKKCANAKLKIANSLLQVEKLNCVINTTLDLFDLGQLTNQERLLIRASVAQSQVAKEIAKPQSNCVLSTTNDGIGRTSQIQRYAQFALKVSAQGGVECVISMQHPKQDTVTKTRLTLTSKENSNLTGIKTLNIIKTQTVDGLIGLSLKKLQEENSEKERQSIILMAINLITVKAIFTYANLTQITYANIDSLSQSQCNSLEVDISSLKMESIKPISNSNLYKMFGNGWTIDVIAHLFTLMQIDRML
jgi:DNA (cytosine-5)-methyltransferase 3A